MIELDEHGLVWMSVLERQTDNVCLDVMSRAPQPPTYNLILSKYEMVAAGKQCVNVIPDLLGLSSLK